MEQIITYTNPKGQSITFNQEAPFVFDAISGLSAVDATLVADKTSGQDGESYRYSQVEKRQIILKALIISADSTSFMEDRKRLISVFNPKLGEGVLKYEYNGVERYVKCVCDGLPEMPTFSNLTNFKCEFILLAHNPFLYLTDILEEFSTIKGGFHFPLAITSSGINAGYRELNFIKNIKNNGDVECGIIAQLQANSAVVNPVITNVTTGEQFRLLYSMASGEKIIIDTAFGEKAIISVLNGVYTNIINDYDIMSDFITLVDGENIIQYGASSGLEYLNLKILFTPLYLGV